MTYLPLSDVHADLEELLADVGDASGSSLGSLYSILGDAAQTFTTVLDRQEHITYFRSDMQASATLDDTGTTDVSLPSVTIATGDLPAGHTIDAVYCHFKYGSRKDTSAVDNAIDGTQYVQVKESASGSYTNAVKIIDNGLPVDVSEATVMGGDVIFGNIDVCSEVATENKTYAFQWLNSKVDGNNLILYDVQTIIEVRWH